MSILNAFFPVAAAVAILQPPTLAQTDDYFATAPLPDTVSNQDRIGRSEVGRLTGDGRPTLVCHAGPRVFVVLAPTVFHAGRALDDGVAHDFTGIAVTPEPDAPRDRLFTLGSRGLGEWTFAPLSGTFLWNAIDPTASGSLLRSGDLNADGYPDLVYAEGSDVVVRLGDGSGGFLSKITGTCAGTIEDLEIARWAGPVDRIVAVLASGDLELRSPTDSIVTIPSNGELHVAIQGFAANGALADDLAWITAEPATGIQRLHRVQAGAPYDMQQMMYLGLAGVAPGGLSRGDVDGDKHDDLTMTFATIPNVVTFFQRPTLPLPFAAHELVTYAYADYGYDTLSQEARPVVADLDSDGDTDIALARQSLSDFHLAKNFASDLLPTTTIEASTWQDVQGPGPGVGPNGSLLHLDVLVSGPPTPDATHIEVDVWEVLPDGTSTADRLGYLAAPIASASSGQLSLSIPLPEHQLSSAAPVPNAVEYYVVVRLVSPLYVGPDNVFELRNPCSFCGTAQQLPNPIRFPGSQLPVPGSSVYGM